MLLSVSNLISLCHPLDEDTYYIITDYCQGGDLLDELEKREHGTLPEKDAAVVINALLSCVNYCHQRGIAHRDLKLENILLPDQDYRDIKVIDLGLAQTVAEGQHLNEVVGTPYYIAPEMLKRKYGLKCDVWSVGVVAFMLLGGYAPFDGDNNKEILKAVRRGEFECDDEAWDNVSDEALEFLIFLLNKNPKQRPSAHEALEHPWLASKRENVLRRSGTRRGSLRNSLTELQKFQSKRCLLKQATSALLASQHQHNDEVKLIGRAFQTLDKTCSGKLTKEDFSAVMGVVFRGDREDSEAKSEEDHDLCNICLDSLFEQVNVSRTGSIDYSEFVGACLLQKNVVDEDRIKEIFKGFDKNNKGYISREDLKMFVSVKDDTTIDKIIKEADTTGKGVINYNDFRSQMMGQAPPSVPSTIVSATNLEVECCHKKEENGLKKFGRRLLGSRKETKKTGVVAGSRYSRQHRISGLVA